VLRRLGIAAEVAPRLRAFPNGAAAMRALAEAHEAGGVGCTQASEILYTPGVTLVGPLPEPFALATDYQAAVAAASDRVSAAREFCAMLGGSQSGILRRRSGFLSNAV